MKVALAFDAARQVEWQAAFARLDLNTLAPIEYVSVSTIAELQAAEPEIVVGYASGFVASFLRDAPASLKWVHFMNAGVDPVAKVLANRTPHFMSSNVRGIHVETMSEFVLMAMLHFAKRVPQWMAQQREHAWQPRPVPLLSGKTVLIVGAGSIGGGIARVCKVLGMQVVGIATREGPRPHFDRIATSMHPHLDAADYVVCSLPLTADTHRLFDPAAFAAMKPGAVFINVGRGEMVDEEAILAALKSGHLGGAALDAHITEPLPPASPLWDAPNLLLTPHVSGRYEGGTVKGAELFAENFRRYVAKQPLATPVDLVRGY